MNSSSRWLPLLKQLIISLAILASPALLAAPQYASEETRRVIGNMLEAHGGLERWQAAPSISYDAVMHNNFHGKNEFAWWVQHEVINQKTRQVYQDWPLDGAQLGFDGKEVWSQNWNRANPPTMMVHFFYYFVNLPWLTQDEGVILGEPRKFTWPEADKELIEISMNFSQAPTVGKTEKDYFVLYIDPDSWRLFGYQYGIGYRRFLDLVNMPEGQETFGPLWRIITKYSEVDGLVFPAAFRTMPEPDARIVGNHVILNIDVSKPFDSAKSVQPEDGVVDLE
jgi:hypothetical protein